MSRSILKAQAGRIGKLMYAGAVTALSAFVSLWSLPLGAAGTHSDTGLTVREKTIVCFGDSLTVGEQSDRVTINNAHFNYGNMNGANQWRGYPLVLQGLLGDEWDVVSVAKGGAATSSVLAWQGAQPMALNADLSLPADTTPVPVAANWGMVNGTAAVKVPDTCFTEKSVWDTGDSSKTTMGSITGTLPDGTRIRWRDNGFTELHDIARLTSGEAKTYPRGTVFTPDSATHFTDCIQVIFTGQNDGGVENQIQSTVPAVESAVSKIQGGRYVVISTHKTRSDEMETAFAAAFGDHYLNLHHELSTRGLSIAVDNGWMTAEAAAATVWDATTGLLANDTIHLNDKGYRVLAFLVKEKLAALGYLGDGQSAKSASPAAPAQGLAEDEGYMTTYSVEGVEYIAQVFTNSAKAITFTVPGGVTSVDCLVVAGGGGGGGKDLGTAAGGGGAGGFVEKTGLAVTPRETLTVTVGAGGKPGGATGQGDTGTTCGTNGGDSAIVGAAGDLVRAIGGGAGNKGKGQVGGSGGGSAHGSAGADGTEGQGHAGGAGSFAGGGGGGAGGVGKAGNNTRTVLTPGGEGLSNSFTGVPTVYATGGNGGCYAAAVKGAAGAANTGNGGDGHSRNVGDKNTPGYAGGSGIVVIRYVKPAACSHAHTEPREAVPSTCTVQGTAAGMWCTDCNDWASGGELLPLAPHQENEGVETKPATCAEEGVRTYSCTECGKELRTEPIPTVDHVYEDGKCKWCEEAAPVSERTVTPMENSDEGYTAAYSVADVEYIAQVFTNSEKAVTFMVPGGVTSVDCLVVAGGGGGGGKDQLTAAGGGGAGGFVETTGLAVTPRETLTVTVGAGGKPGGATGQGGTGTTCGANGGDSVIVGAAGDLVRATGGGAGNKGKGQVGGSGGGSAHGSAGAAGTEGQGHAGGAGSQGAGGGGGAGTAGSAGNGTRTVLTPGGEGLSSSFTGVPTVYATGGNGGCFAAPVKGAAGAANTGNGGDGHSRNVGDANTPGYAGGSGIVVIRYVKPIEGCPHAHTEAREAVPSTCTVQGSAAGVWCTDCNDWVSGGELLPLAPHQENGGVETKPATCTEKGIRTYSCETCGVELRTEPIDRVPHELHFDKEEEGTKYYTCTVCGLHQLEGGADFTWTGDGDGTSWNDPANWGGESYPGTGSTATEAKFAAGESAVIDLGGRTIEVALLSLANGCGKITFRNGKISYLKSAIGTSTAATCELCVKDYGSLVYRCGDAQSQQVYGKMTLEAATSYTETGSKIMYLQDSCRVFVGQDATFRSVYALYLAANARIDLDGGTVLIRDGRHDGSGNWVADKCDRKCFKGTGLVDFNSNQQYGYFNFTADSETTFAVDPGVTVRYYGVAAGEQGAVCHLKSGTFAIASACDACGFKNRKDPSVFDFPANSKAKLVLPFAPTSLQALFDSICFSAGANGYGPRITYAGAPVASVADLKSAFVVETAGGKTTLSLKPKGLLLMIR